LAAALLLASCGPSEHRVATQDYDSFWLWPGVEPPAAAAKAKSLYLLDGEILASEPARYVQLRAAPPRLAEPQVWLVVRTDTLDWPEGVAEALPARLDRWAQSSPHVAGLQLDFDARTRHLDRYAAFLEHIRATLPRRYRLSITGLMDWSANGDPKQLKRLAGTIDEVVIQTYQGRSTIPGYDAYFKRMRDFPIPFKVGLVEGGLWSEPRGLEREPSFRGYVVFVTSLRA